MGKLITTTKPLILQSKLLCFSLFYLFTTFFLALYTTLSQSKCFFRSSPSDPIQNPLFSYPSSYGEHKYAVSTTRETCSSPVFFSGYSAHSSVLFCPKRENVEFLSFVFCLCDQVGNFSLMGCGYWIQITGIL